MKHAKPLLFLSSVAITTMNPAFGHGGEDHGAPPPPCRQAVELRTAATEEFEVVTLAVRRQRNWWCMSIRFAAKRTRGAGQGVEIGEAQAHRRANETPPGTYVRCDRARAASQTSADHQCVEAGDSVDLLSPRWIPQPRGHRVHTHGWSEWVIWEVSGSATVDTGILLPFAPKPARRD